MTPRVWMNILNGQIVIAWPWIQMLDGCDQYGCPYLQRIGWIIEAEKSRVCVVSTPVMLSKQFYDIGEW